jgi:hypothetical protein
LVKPNFTKKARARYFEYDVNRGRGLNGCKRNLALLKILKNYGKISSNLFYFARGFGTKNAPFRSRVKIWMALNK